jgi:2-polyprenyl-3-methyl-5-hydroxy-6-metoxy-1,4-benzoquinol methylase
MAQPTERAIAPDQEALSFYDSLASDYDEMTRFDGRFKREGRFFQTIVERFGIRSALDAGCGTGFHALLLAQLGVQVTAVDISPRMIYRLQEHARRMNLSVHSEALNLRDLDETLTGNMDAVFCMGNTLAHAEDPADLTIILNRFVNLLRPGGILLLQTLNYEKILSEAKLIQNVKEQGGVFYVRFYEYAGSRIRFHILRLSRSGTEATHSLRSVTLTPFRMKDLTDSAAHAGFVKIQTYGDIAFNPYSSDGSRDAVVLGTKPD